ncbi:diguanylate cyclase domain-containing protein [Deinococcus cellulosilyticus]|uniref:GGDEF domain-containing protein n=1 Tax=Deinococcus cellulosilyticus (strain DSM 18568 / NBRC 106333 / KACC 11606 / 5516J-15) TaxID=1223518 RepID=A0A511N0G7_DEIC1|nr:diguanylate cyclase [Deinococcus cellulosilyticus]GEM46352.1 GGDEF domain-containing protein [Deinococcus cellulosilyticus NBRC 106333 = KACC 11606]
MTGPIDTLFINLCMVVALSYLISLTYTRWKVVEDDWRLKVARSLMAALCAVLLLMHGLKFQETIILDLKLVPILLIVLRYGPLYGLLSSLPLLMVRLTVLQDLPPQLFLTGYTLFMLTLLGVHKSITQDVKPYLRACALSLFAYHLPWAFSPRRAELLLVMLPSVLFNMLGFAIAMMVIRSRILYLKATHHLRTEAQTDPLTGIYNRRQFEMDMPGLNPGDSLLLLDLDHFKQVNDRHGHQTGDRVLQEFTALLQSCTRNRDRVYRIGGEEFLVVLRAVTPAGSARIAERIRSQVAAHAFEAVGQLTVSGGWCMLQQDRAVEDTLQQADHFLYQAKQQGRNQMCCCLDPQQALPSLE